MVSSAGSPLESEHEYLPLEPVRAHDEFLSGRSRLLCVAGSSVIVVVGLFSVQEIVSRSVALEDEARAAKFNYPAGRYSAFVHLFEWDWPSVASECENWLAPSGFNAVQVSPPNEHIIGNTWWTRYQPVSYELVSRSGNETELIDMVKRCSAVGVRVIFDVVPNHMAFGKGIGINGSEFTGRTFPAAGYSLDDFHHLPSTPTANCGISNWDDIDNVQRCDLDGLPDLCTGCKHTRQTISKFFAKLGNMGLTGLRIDSAKCINVAELGTILNESGQPWNFQEVYPLWDYPDIVKPEMYIVNGLVTDFGLAHYIAPRFRGLHGSLAGILNFGTSLPSDSVVTFVDNHDTQRKHDKYGLTYRDGDLYFLAVVFTLAVPYGYPKVLSSYAFSYFDEPPPKYPAMRCKGGWMCEHRRPEIAHMIDWRRCAGLNLAADHVQEDDSGDHIAFSRGGSAFIALNRGQHAWHTTLQTGLPKGKYCNIIEDTKLETCSIVEVDNHGNAAFFVKPLKAVAIHVTC